MFRLVKVFNHIKNGTLLDRLMLIIEPLRRNVQLTRWDRITSKRKEFVYKLTYGVRMFLYSDCVLSQAIFVHKFEAKELSFLSLFLRKGDIFLDIGSNFGLYSLIASKKVGKKGQIYAFEPVTKTFNRLMRNIKLNRINNITSIKTAVSSNNSTMPMSISLDGHDAWNSLTKPARGEKFQTEEVKTITLDDFVKQYDLYNKIKMIKIDVEGWECEVIKGSYKTFISDMAPILQVEFSEPALLAGGSSSGILIKMLSNLGYKLYMYSIKNKKMIEFEYHGEPLDRNLYAIKKIEPILQILQN